MKSMSEAMWTILNNMAEANFDVIRDKCTVGKVVGIPVKEKQYIEVIKSTTDLMPTDCLIDGSKKRIVITRTEKVDNHIRIYYSESDSD